MEARTGRATERPRDQQTPRRSPPCRGDRRVRRPGRAHGRLQQFDPAPRPLDLRLCRPIRPRDVLLLGRPAIRPDTRPARSAQEPHRPAHGESWSDAHECRGRPPPGRPSGRRRKTARPAIETPPAPLFAAAVDRADSGICLLDAPARRTHATPGPRACGPGPPQTRRCTRRPRSPCPRHPCPVRCSLPASRGRPRSGGDRPRGGSSPRQRTPLRSRRLRRRAVPGPAGAPGAHVLAVVPTRPHRSDSAASIPTDPAARRTRTRRRRRLDG